MSELAELMARNGAGDAALLFRVPGQLRAAAEAKTYGVGPQPCSQERPAVRDTVGDLRLSTRAFRHALATAN